MEKYRPTDLSMVSSDKQENGILQGKRVTYVTLGCKLNFAETSALGDRLASEGAIRAQEGEQADICVVNTCSVTETSDHKCRQAIHKVIRNNPGAFVMVLGCYAQLAPQVIAQMEGVDLVLGMEQKGDAVKYLKEKLVLREKLKQEDDLSSLHESFSVPLNEIKTFVPSCSRGERTRYFLKVQDGCNYFCTYCTIPFARGRSRNGSIASLVEQAQEVARQGGKEIVITGVNIGDFGHSTGETFYQLVQALDKVEGIERYRISSIEPNLLTPEIIDFCRESRAFMPHFHIPLQSGSDEVLKLMRRRYDTRFFADRIHYINKVWPEAFIGVDIIVGTRGETDALFEEAYSFVQSINVAQLHVFSYSERPGTMALKIPHKVSDSSMHQRSQRLLSLSEQKRIGFYSRFRGTVRSVLLEHSGKGQAVKGFTDNYIRVEMPQLKSIEGDNHIVNVLLGDFNEDKSALTGQIVASE